MLEIEGTNSLPTSAPTEVARSCGESSTFDGDAWCWISCGLDMSRLRCVMIREFLGDFGDLVDSDENEPPLLRWEMGSCGDKESLRWL